MLKKFLCQLWCLLSPINPSEWYSFQHLLEEFSLTRISCVIQSNGNTTHSDFIYSLLFPLFTYIHHLWWLFSDDCFLNNSIEELWIDNYSKLFRVWEQWMLVKGIKLFWCFVTEQLRNWYLFWSQLAVWPFIIPSIFL